VFVDLVTAASLPDAGEVRAFGTATSDITDADAWLGVLDRFGILSERVVLLDDLTAAQNLALPLSLELDDPTDDVRKSVARRAAECGITDEVMRTPVGQASPFDRARIRLAKALALDPRVLLAEHPNALVAAEVSAELGRLLAAVAAARTLAMLVLTADVAFAAAAAGTNVMTLAPSTGQISRISRWRSWLSR
jgi:ABC-type lipoprotein export system ATPase subunit